MRCVTAVQRVRQTIKQDKIITQEMLDEMELVIKYEKENGIDNYCKAYKGNRLSVINKFLYNTDLMPNERLCYNYTAQPTSAKGRIKIIKKNIEINHIKTAKDFGYYELILGDKKYKYSSQKDIIGHLNDCFHVISHKK